MNGYSGGSITGFSNSDYSMTIVHPSLSIVIPTKNGGKDFVDLLQALRNQLHFSDADIIVVDSGSTDDTVGQARSYGAIVIPIDPLTFNHGATRNLGIQKSTGELIALFTQDAVPLGESFLHTLVNSIQEHQAAGIYARQVPRPDASPLVKRAMEAWVSSSSQKRITRFSSANEFFQQLPMEQYITCVFDDVAGLIRREVWEKIPLPVVPFGEDVEWAFRVLCNGYTIVYEPEATVRHSHERSPTYLYQRTYIDHYRLYELFGLRTISSRRNAWIAILKTIGKDWQYLLGNPRNGYSFFRTLIRVPQFAWASVWGQYRGAKAAACGLPFVSSRDV